MINLAALAYIIALKAHEGQVDKGGNPYINHPLRVCNACENTTARIVAILHDVVEDTDITLDYLREQGFSEEITNAIDNLTRREGETYKEFILRCKSDPISKEVKIQDLKDNMDLARIPELAKKDFDRFHKYEKALKILNT